METRYLLSDSVDGHKARKETNNQSEHLEAAQYCKHCQQSVFLLPMNICLFISYQISVKHSYMTILANVNE